MVVLVTRASGRQTLGSKIIVSRSVSSRTTVSSVLEEDSLSSAVPEDVISGDPRLEYSMENYAAVEALKS